MPTSHICRRDHNRLSGLIKFKVRVASHFLTFWTLSFIMCVKLNMCAAEHLLWLCFGREREVTMLWSTLVPVFVTEGESISSQREAPLLHRSPLMLTRTDGTQKHAANKMTVLFFLRPSGCDFPLCTIPNLNGGLCVVNRCRSSYINISSKR